MKNAIFIFLIFIIVLSGCRKYKEGPLISFRSPEKRISGTWQITEFTGNGVDSLQYYNDSCGANIGIALEYYDSDNFIMQFEGCKQNISGGFHFESFDNIIVHFNYGAYGAKYRIIGPIVSGVTSSWKILRLTKDELKVSVDYDNKNYEMFFKKI